MRRWPALALLLVLGGLSSGCAPTVLSAGPPVVAPQLEPDALVMADGARLPLRATLPDGPVKAIIVGVHGFNDYSDAFRELGAALAPRGIAVYAYDQRGFGKAPDVGGWAGDQTLTSDLTTVVRLIKARHPGVPIFALGESMGGSVVLEAATGPDPPPVDGVILSAPAVWGRATLGLLGRVALSVFSHTVPWFPLTGQGLHIEPTDNRQVMIRLSRDPLVLKRAKVGSLHGLVDLEDAALAGAPRLTMPALILYGARDELVPPEAMCFLLHHLPPRPAGRWRFVEYRMGYHLLTRDLDGPLVSDDIAAWIADRTAALPSGNEAAQPDVDRMPPCVKADE